MELGTNLSDDICKLPISILVCTFALYGEGMATSPAQMTGYIRTAKPLTLICQAEYAIEKVFLRGDIKKF